MNVGLIGGTGVDEMEGFVSGQRETVYTRFGDAEVIIGEIDQSRVVFVPRHGFSHSVPPSKINYRAQIAALKKIGIEQVIGVCAVGSLRKDLLPGTLAILGDFIDLTKGRIDTFFDAPEGPVVHTDFTYPYCPTVSDALYKACRDEGINVFQNTVYIGVEGPRYESPAEIRLYASWGGDVIGMTNLPEAVLAREAGLCYGALGVVTNLACGISPTPLTHEEVRFIMVATADGLQRVVRKAIHELHGRCDSTCRVNNALKI
ncbi:MAG: S-methyl-5'-thioinosine phosphorylase [Armatimonadota bacterium]|nr:S-methyl-5'-thioinosine phosphorylase [bacterium]